MQIQFSKDKIRKASAFMGLISSPPRLGILCILSQEEQNVGQLAVRVGLSQSAVSQHLQKLRNAKIVKTRKVRQTIYYSLLDKTAKEILHALHKIYCK